jgi:hypothetical protein
MNPLVYVGLFFFVLSIAFAWPGYRRQSIAGATLKAFLVVVLPLTLFLLSLMLGPDCKAAAPYGAFNSYQTGKVMLVPIALWATAGLYAVEILRRVPPPRWAAWGIISGAVVSVVTLEFFAVMDLTPTLFAARRPWQPAMTWGDLVGPAIVCAFPGYVTAWYVWRAWQFVGREHVETSDALTVIGLSTPFWLATAWYTRQVYDALPAECSGCFIVTAATRGHPAIVGPFVELAPGYRVNRQLERFWRFEAAWRARHPASHAAARRVYDRVAPPIAARIRSRWCADVVYLVLKPLELLVAAATSATRRR